MPEALRSRVAGELSAIKRSGIDRFPEVPAVSNALLAKTMFLPLLLTGLNHLRRGRVAGAVSILMGRLLPRRGDDPALLCWP